MGFLDDIVEELTATSADRTEPEAKTPPASTMSGKLDTGRHQEQPADTGNDDLWRPSEKDFAERKRIMSQKPERLSFLQPCPICKGRSFIHIIGGGFVCRTCQPGFFGQPVEATGADRQPDQELRMANDGDMAAGLFTP